MTKEIEFKESDLVKGLAEALDHARGKRTLKTTKVPARTYALSPGAIVRIRRRLNASTPVFAAYLNVSTDTVRKWEKQLRKPSGPALRLLQIAEKRPEVLLASADGNPSSMRQIERSRDQAATGVYIERLSDGSYCVNDKAEAWGGVIEPTQAGAIERTKEIFSRTGPEIERVRKITKSALASIKRGIKDSVAGRTKNLGSFAVHAKD